MAFEIAPVAALLPWWSQSASAVQAEAGSRGGKSPRREEPEWAQRWRNLGKKETAEITRRNIHGLMRAAHLYDEDHGSLPPSVIANPELPGGKRLSGLVLLLPYLNAESWINEGKPCFDAETVKLGRELYEMIVQTKAWDDPANLQAAKTLMPAFLAPQSAPFRDRDGIAVSHFAFVQGSLNDFDGAFPGESGVKISDIKDGTVATLGFGQVVNDTGPWIAEGLSTARQVYAKTATSPGAFGSQFQSGCFFAMCDSSPFFHRTDAAADVVLQQAATRSGGEFLNNMEITRQSLPFEFDEPR
jgi:hypothetical protein